MTEKHKALGRGLESLLPPRPIPFPGTPAGTAPSAAPTYSPTLSGKGGAAADVPPTLSPTAGEKEPALSLPKGGAPDPAAAATTVLLPGEAVLEITLDLLDDN